MRLAPLLVTKAYQQKAVSIVDQHKYSGVHNDLLQMSTQQKITRNRSQNLSALDGGEQMCMGELRPRKAYKCSLTLKLMYAFPEARRKNDNHPRHLRTKCRSTHKRYISSPKPVRAV